MKMLEIIWSKNTPCDWIDNLPVPLSTSGFVDEDVENEAEVVLLRAGYIISFNPEGLIGDLGFSEHILDSIMYGVP